MRRTSQRMRAWSAESGRSFVPAKFVYVPHAHSLYVNILVERGAVGFVYRFRVHKLLFIGRAGPRASALDSVFEMREYPGPVPVAGPRRIVDTDGVRLPSRPAGSR